MAHCSQVSTNLCCAMCQGCNRSVPNMLSYVPAAICHGSQRVEAFEKPACGPLGDPQAQIPIDHISQNSGRLSSCSVMAGFEPVTCGL